MTGCRHNAKNTLVKNYLALAESAGAEVQPMTTVTGFEQFGEGYAIDVKRTDAPRRAAGGSTPSRSSWPPARTTPSGFCTR